MKKVLALILCLAMMLTVLTSLTVTATAETAVNTELTAHLRVLYPGTSDLEKEIAPLDYSGKVLD